MYDFPLRPGVPVDPGPTNELLQYERELPLRRRQEAARPLTWGRYYVGGAPVAFLTEAEEHAFTQQTAGLTPVAEEGAERMRGVRAPTAA